jgi:hypothetical protein
MTSDDGEMPEMDGVPEPVVLGASSEGAMEPPY